MCSTHGREHLRQRSIAIPQVLELHELGDECVDLALFLRRRKQEQNAVEITFLRHDPLFAKIVRDNRGWNAEGVVLTSLAINAWREQGQLIWIDHGVPIRVARVAVPCSVWLEPPALLLLFDQLGWKTLPWHINPISCSVAAADRHNVGHERIEEPFLLGVFPGLLIVPAEIPQLLASLDAEF